MKIVYTEDATLLPRPRAAELLGVSNYVLRRMLEDGQLQSVVIGGRTYIPLQSIQNFLAGMAGDE